MPSSHLKPNFSIKITACLDSWGKFWTKILKIDQGKKLPFWGTWTNSRGLGTKAGYCTRSAVDGTTKGVGKPPKPLFQPDPWTHSSPCIRSQLTHCQQGNLLFSFPTATVGAPIKPFLKKKAIFCTSLHYKHITPPPKKKCPIWFARKRK